MRYFILSRDFSPLELSLGHKLIAKLEIFSAHAPYDHDTLDAKDTFLDDLGRHVGAAKAHVSRIFILIDASARVGSTLCSAVGASDPDTENDNGERFRSSPEPSQLVAVNTFCSAGGTWAS